MRRLIALLVLCLWAAGAVTAQDNEPLPQVSLRTDETALMTGQFYTVRIDVDGIDRLWLADVEVEYDPEALFVVGTDSGSPVTAGDLMPSASAITIFNRAADGTLKYTRSMLAPAEPVSGSGTLGTFRIFPLQAGDVQLRFTLADMLYVEFTETEAGERVGNDPERLDVQPVLLVLSITGDTVTPPPEQTATPTVTPTDEPTITAEAAQTATPSVTPLVNVTAAPVTPTPLELIPELEAEDGAGVDPIIPVGIALVVLAGLGLLALFITGRRR